MSKRAVIREIDGKTYIIAEPPSEADMISMWVIAGATIYFVFRMMRELRTFAQILGGF